MTALTRTLVGAAALLATACAGSGGSDDGSELSAPSIGASGNAGVGGDTATGAAGANISAGGSPYNGGGANLSAGGAPNGVNNAATSASGAVGGAGATGIGPPPYGSAGAAGSQGSPPSSSGAVGWSAGGSPYGAGGTSASMGGAAGSTAEPPAFDCDPSQTLSPGDHEFTIVSANGLTYRYVLVMPSTVVPGKKAPLAVVWHALWSNPEETRGLTHIDATMAARGMISVHPRSPDQAWDVGTCCTNYVLGSRRDETVFARELLADVEAKVCVDTHRVYTAGFSNGGMLSQMLACRMADVFAAAAPMASTLTIPPGECNPSRPIPIYMINGTADPLVGYSMTGLSGGLTVQDSFKTWADRDVCTGTPQTTLQRGKATCQTYSQCGAGSDVTLCSVEGMGHCMPGMKKESPTNCFTKNLILLGMPNDDIDGIDLSAEFLSRHSLP